MHELRVGDIVFIRAKSALFRAVGNATGSWINHVGIIVGHDGADYVVAESRVPLSSKTSLRRFIARSQDGRYSVHRLQRMLSPSEQHALCQQAERRLGVFYHQGFKLRSKRQFCSKFVHEVYADGLGVELGCVETFAQLLAREPNVSTTFWRLWFLGRIPWDRETITPASIYRNPQLITVAHSHAQ